MNGEARAAGTGASLAGEQLRLFFAVKLAEELREAVQEVQDRLARSGAKVKWVAPKNLHITLKFLGDMSPETVDELITAAEPVAGGHEAFELGFGGAGAFPNPARARAVWLACTAGSQALVALGEGLDTQLAEAKLAGRDERPFRAHLTIGRSKGHQGRRELQAAIQEASRVDVGRMGVDHFSLIHSQLTQAGPVYTEVDRFALGGMPGGSARPGPGAAIIHGVSGALQ